MTARPSLLVAARASAVLVAVLVFVQAVIAGQAYIGERLDIEVHGYVGNASFALSVVTVVLALLGGARRDVVLPAVVVVLMFAQTGLGYVGRDSADAAAIHIPLGVLVFALTVLVATRPFRTDRPAVPASADPGPAAAAPVLGSAGRPTHR